MSTKNFFWVSLVGLVIVVNLSGCDSFKKIGEYFSEKPKTAVKAPAAVTPAASTQPNQKNIPAAKTENPAAPVVAAAKTNTLAKVGNWTITLPEFKERLAALKEAVPDYNIKDVKQNKAILQELIRQQLLVDEAEKGGVAKNKDIAMAVEEFRRTMLVREMANQLTKDVKVTEEEARKYYDENKKDFAEPSEWHLREIVLGTEDDAKKTLAEIMNGADFGETAKQKSKTKSAWKKGDLGFVKTFDFPQMESAASALEVGGVSGVFKGPEGFYIVKLEEKKGGQAKSFDALKEEIVNGLTLLKKQQVLLDHLDKLQKQADIQVNEKLLEE
jgi:peptidyl-prolyl cis-trans isomerase C